MNNSKTVLTTSLAAVLGFSAIGAQASVLNMYDLLTLTAGVIAYDSSSNAYVASGSYFAMDYNANSKISGNEKNVLAMGSTGIMIGVATTPGASHSGNVTAGDANAIDAPWNFFGNTGSDYTTVGITGGTTSGLNMSGWTVTWNTIASIPMGSGAWQTATGAGHSGAPGIFTDGIGNFTWSGVYGTAYTLDYRATVPIGDASGFGGVQYELHLEGIVYPSIPVPAAAWLFGSGLVGLIGVVRRNGKA